MGNIKEAFGEHLKKVRNEKGLTQQALADLMETTIQTIGNLERGQHWPSHETVEELLAVLGVQPAELFGFAWGKRKNKVR